MRRFKPHASIAIAVLLLSACGESTPPDTATAQPTPPAELTPAAPEPAAAEAKSDLITARSLLDQALAEAQKWQADAQLIGVTTSLADGPAHSFWFYDLQSPSQGTCTRIRAMANGSVTNVGSGDACILSKPVSTGFVDSPVAYEAALAAGFRKGESVQFGLSYSGDEALPAPRECWVVWSDPDGDEETGTIRGWCVDPQSGAFVTRLAGRGLPVRAD